MATVNEAAAQQLVDAGVVERQPPGAYDLDTVREAVFRQLRAVASARGTGIRLADERALLSKRQRELVELKTAQLRGSTFAASVRCATHPQELIERAAGVGYPRRPHRLTDL
jgi:hypothetical protein